MTDYWRAEKVKLIIDRAGEMNPKMVNGFVNDKVPGLAVTPWHGSLATHKDDGKDWYGVTHLKSGALITKRALTRDQAKYLLEAVADVADWTQAMHIVNTKTVVKRIGYALKQMGEIDG